MAPKSTASQSDSDEWKLDGSTAQPRRHPKHYGSEQLIFRVEDILYRVSKSVLKSSPHFRDMLGSEHIGDDAEGASDARPIALVGITSYEMGNFLEVLNAQLVNGRLELTFAQWEAALHLASMWTFDAVRVHIIQQVEISFPDQDPMDYIEVALRCRVSQWLHPAYRRLCERREALSAADGTRLGLEKFAALCAIREIKGPGRGCAKCDNCKANRQCIKVPKAYADLVAEEDVLRVPF